MPVLFHRLTFLTLDLSILRQRTVFHLLRLSGGVPFHEVVYQTADLIKAANGILGGVLTDRGITAHMLLPPFRQTIPEMFLFVINGHELYQTV